MSRYIDANLISYEHHDRLGLGIDYGTTDKSTYEIAYKSQIDKIPTADVEEVRHGEWIPIQGEYHWAETGVVDPVILGYKCSICGDEEKYKYKYCHCGAKMDGGKDGIDTTT